jgi:hypothetical protein
MGRPLGGSRRDPRLDREGLLVVRKEPFDLGPQLGIPRADLVEVRGTLRRLKAACGRENAFHLLMAFGCHGQGCSRVVAARLGRNLGYSGLTAKSRDN